MGLGSVPVGEYFLLENKQKSGKFEHLWWNGPPWPQDRVCKWSGHPAEARERIGSKVPIPRGWGGGWGASDQRALCPAQAWAETGWTVPRKCPGWLPSAPYPSPELVPDSLTLKGPCYSQPYEPCNGWSFYQRHSSTRHLERDSLV